MAKAYIGGLQMNGTSDEPSDYVVYGLKMDEWDTGDTEFKSMAYYVKNVQLPSGVTTIGDEAFKGYGASAMTLPSGITYIGTEAFSKMENLETMNFGYMIDGVGYGLFKGCTALTGITIESGVVEHDDTEWGGEVWYENKWAGFDLNNETFSGCTSLTGVPVTERMYNVGKNCFTDCQSLTEFTFPPNVGNFGGYDYTDNDRGVFEGTSLSSVTFNEQQMSPYNNASLPPKCFKGLSNLQVSGGPIGDYAYEGCSSLSGYTVIPIPQRDWDEYRYTPGYKGAFKSCPSLKSVTLKCDEDGKIKLGQEFFQFCSSLSSLTVDTGDFTGTPVITECGHHAFENTKLSTIPYTITEKYIGESTFRGMENLTSITLSGTVEIGKGCFYMDNALSSVTLPDTVEKIDSQAFLNITGMTSVNTPANLKEVGSGAFKGVGITDATIKSGVTYGSSVYGECKKLSGVTIESGVTAIPSGMFYNDSGLTSIVIPDTITSVGDVAFEKTSLTDVTIKSGVTYGYAPYRYIKTLTGFTIESGVTEIPEEVIAVENTGDSNTYFDINIPGTAKTIKRQAFYRRKISGLTFGDGVETIEGYAFNDCEVLSPSDLATSGIVLPDSVKDIGGQDYWNGGFSFSGCNVDRFEVGSGCTHIARGAFAAEGTKSGQWTGVTFTIHATVPPTLDESNAFKQTTYGIKHIYVPAESVDAYKAATNWSVYANIIEAIPAT